MTRVGQTRSQRGEIVEFLSFDPRDSPPVPVAPLTADHILRLR